MTALRLDTPVQFLKGVGPRRAEAFGRLRVCTVEDLLYHTPHRYLDATAVTPIANAVVGQEGTFVGRVVSKAVMPTRKRLHIFRAVLKDASGVIECAWPGQAFLDRVIKQGQLLLVAGAVKYYHGRQVVPREQVVLAESGDTNGGGDMDRGVVVPIYPATEGLSHRIIRNILSDHLDAMLQTVQDHLPEHVRRAGGFLPLRQALEVLHRPPAPPADPAARSWEAGRRRLAFDELLDLQLVVARARHLAQSAPKGQRFEIKRELTTALKRGLPFALTADQRRAIREVSADMTSDKRMHRLLMGDVGTGKTIVALFAMLLAVENDAQAVFMAPTELLAEQHGRAIGELLAPLGIVPEVLVGKLSPGEKSSIRERIASGASPVVVGTHALIQEQTDFRRLGLVVIDEQQRFGVEQRAALIEKGQAPEVLLLSATPIPRTLALTLYGDLDISVLKERPQNRPLVRTGVRYERDRAAVYGFLQEQCARGRQVYVVYPVIEESEKVDLKAATTMADVLRQRLAPFTVGLMHGRMRADEREDTMRAFRDGALHVLVATTVIEVGIDVPNATVMLVEHPERFGLAQLHQLRGRVGRGSDESHCILLVSTRGPAADRLRRFARTGDGFAIADQDLQERGIGELTGVRQSGGFNLRYANLASDGDLVAAGRKAALDIIERDPNLSTPEHAALRSRIERRYERGMELFRVG